MSSRLHYLHSPTHESQPISAAEKFLGKRQHHYVAYNVGTGDFLRYTAPTFHPAHYQKLYPDAKPLINTHDNQSQLVIFEDLSGSTERWRKNLDHFTPHQKKMIEAAWIKSQAGKTPSRSVDSITSTPPSGSFSPQG